MPSPSRSYSQLCGQALSSLTGQPSWVWKFPASATLLIESEPRLVAGSKTKVTAAPLAGMRSTMFPDPPCRPKFGLLQSSFVANLY